MKKAFLLLTILGLTNLLLAQETLTTFEPIASKPKITALLSNANEEGTLGISYFFNSNLYWNAVGADGELLEKMTLKLGNYRVRPRGAIHSTNQFFHFYENTDDKKLKIISVNKDGRSSKIIEQDLLAKKEKFICHIANNQEYYAVALNKKTKELKLHRFNTEKESFDTKTIMLKDFLVEKLYKVKFVPIVKESMMDPAKAAAFLKAYIQADDKLLLSIDGKSARGSGTTEILLIDWATATVSTKVIGQSELWADEHTKSLIYKDHIYRITAVKERLKIEIYSLADFSLVKEYAYEANEEIAILDSPFFTESQGNNGFYLFNPARKEKNIDRPETKKMLKKLAVGTPFIIAESYEDNQTLLTVGTYIQINAGGGMFMPGTSGSSINTPNGPVSMPGTPGGFVGGRASGYKQSRFFYSVLNVPGFAHVEDAVTTKKVMNPIHEFVEKKLTNKHVYSIANYGKRTAVIHYLRSDKEIKIHLFE